MTKPNMLSRPQVRQLAAAHYAALLTQDLRGNDGSKHLVELAMRDLRLGSDLNRPDVDRLLVTYLGELERVVEKDKFKRGARPFWIGFALELFGYTCVALLGLTIWIMTAS